MILQADARHLPLRDQSVGGVITSPPYNAGKNYANDSFPDWEQYLDFLHDAFRECQRVSRGPVCWVLPLMLRGHFIYAEVGTWQFATPIIAASEKIVTVGDQFGRGWTRAYVGVEVLVCTEKPRAGVWIPFHRLPAMCEPVIFAPAPFVGPDERNRPRHPAPFVREVPGSAMRMFPEVQSWLDPFAGTGTTAMAAQDRRLRWVSMDLEWGWCEVQRKELAQESLWLSGASPRKRHWSDPHPMTPGLPLDGTFPIHQEETP